MADEDTSIKLLIEAEDLSREAFEKAKRNTEDLKKAETDLWRTINDAQKTANMTGKEYFAMRAQAVQVGQQLQRSYGTQAAALQHLVQAQNAHTAAVQKHGQAATSAFGAAGNALLSYTKHFLTLAAAEHVIRRSIVAFAEFERGQQRIQMQTGATAKEIDHLGHSFDAIARTTGQEVAAIQKSFLTFSAEMGSAGKDVEEMFKQVQAAAHASGVAFETMSKTAVTAVKTMDVPMGEVKGMLDVIVKDIPASAMSAWDNVAPRILGILRSLGSTGKDSVQQAATSFGALAAAMGNAQAAGSTMEQMLRKATDQSSTFGKMMTPQLIELQKQQAGVTKQFEAMYQMMNQMGIFSDDPQMALVMQQKFGFSDDMVLAARKYHAVYLEIVEAVDKGEAWDTAEKRILHMHRGAQASVDGLKAAFEELYVTIGSALGGVIPDALANAVTGIKNDMQIILDAFKWFRGQTGSGDPSKKSWSQSAADLPGNPLPNWLSGAKGGAPTTIFGTPVPSGPFGPGGWFGSGAGITGGRPAPALKGYALGGEFEVGGRAGGGDKEPVSFMASPGEKVAVSTPMAESLQQQQDKADIAMREHFARFHGSAFTKTVAAPWWPSSAVRAPGGGGGTGAAGGMGSTGTPGGGGGGGGGGGNGPDNKSGNDPPNTGPRADPRTSYDPRYPGNAPAGQTPSLTGPFGQVMPAWGAVTTDPGGVYWGGGTGTGAAGNVPGLAGGPSGRALTKEERAAQAPPAGGGGGDGGGTPTGGGSAYLAKQRAAMFAELDKDPAAKATLLRLMKAENHSTAPGARAAVLERLVNAAMKSGKSIKHHMYDGYYGPMKGGGPAAISDADAAVSQRELDTVRGGSNIIDFRTKQGMWNEKHREHPWTKQVGPEKSRLKNINGEFFSDADQKTQDWANREREKMIAHDKGVKGGGPQQPQSTALGPDALPPPGTVPPGSRTTAGIEPEPGQPRTTGTTGGTTEAGGDKTVMDKNAIARLKGVDPVLVQAVREGSKFLPDGYKMVPTSGMIGRSGKGYHPSGNASDWKIIRPDGTEMPNRGWGKEETELHQKVAQGAYGWLLKNHPEKAKRFEWGGAFDTSAGSGQPDLMHYDFGGRRGRYASRSITKIGAIYPGKDAPTTTAKPADPKVPDNKPAAAPTNVSQGKAGSPSGPAAKTAAKPPDNKPATAPANTAAAPDTKVAAVTPDAPDPRNKAPSEGKQWGGTVRGGRRYTVGESGPETFTPAGPGEITPGGMNIGGMMGEFSKFADMMRQPITPNIQMPRAGPIRQRMSRHVEAQRERDVGRMTRHAAHSDIGFT